MLACRREQLGAVLRHHFFVRSDDKLAGLERITKVAVRGLFAAHHFNDQLDFGIVENILRAVGEQRWIDREIALLRWIAHQHVADREWTADLPFVDVGLLLQDAGDAAADDA